MNQKNNLKTIPEQTVDLFANAIEESKEIIDKKRIQATIAEQRLIAALDVELSNYIR
ncbi:MAG: hypothetical protein IPN42_17910 [Methylococcaceae bacterium]|nr:hypothetical protein [Methylococcaceae bacterium]